MKIAFTVSGTDITAAMDPRFGRCAGFLVYDLDKDSFTVNENRNIGAAQGAGIQSAEAVVRLGAKALITGSCGPKAFQVLRASGVRIYTTNAATAAEALALYRQGKLLEISSPNSQGRGRRA